VTIRKLLLIPLLLSVGLFVYFGADIWKTAQHVISNVHITWQFIVFVLIALIFQFIGHVLRAKKASLLMAPVENSKISTQFRAFSVGQLFNNLLPFRIGELIRAGILAQKLSTSFIYSLTLIIFERLLDLAIVAILAFIALLVAGLFFGLISTTIVMVIIATVGLFGIYIYTRQPRWLQRLLYTTTALFNNRIKDMTRFKLWSLVYGLNRSFSRAQASRYAILTITMWLSYLLTTACIAFAVFSDLNIVDVFMASIAPYFGIAVPAGPAGLGSFSGVVTQLATNITNQDVTVFIIVSWAVLVVPISLVGIALLFAKTAEPIWSKRPTASSDESISNKLSRSEDISGELSIFLENYFDGSDLSRIVDRLERQGKFSLVKYFKGGSDAITILTLKDNKRVVKKIIALDLKDRLKAQYDWLRKYQSNTAIVSASNEKTGEDYYSIDLAFDSSSVSLFDYVHEISLLDAQKLLLNTWSSLFDSVYGNLKQVKIPGSAIDAYIDRHVFQCLDKAIAVDKEIEKATLPGKIKINGKEYDNLYQVLEKIKKNKKAWSDLRTYRESGTVHGDVIMDNLLYSKKSKRVIIIDPAPDGNIIEGPVFDFGKSIQSLHCGYEFLLRDEAAVTLEEGDRIAFSETKSTRFGELDNYVSTEIADRYLTNEERRAMLFHGGVLYIRRLKHQVYYTPENALKFYAVGVRTLNEFLDQYQ